VGRGVEALIAVALSGRGRAPAGAEAGAGVRAARTCHDHLAGRLGVAVTDAMVHRKWLEPRGKDYRVTARGDASLRALGVEVDRARGQRRTFARQCLDWSERRAHLAGALGAAFASRCFELGWLDRASAGRQVILSERGRRGLDRALAVGRRLNRARP
jgi:hypothetical protein